MVIGNGMIAKSFNRYNKSDKVVIFASGVANSKEVKPENFQREKELLIDTISAIKNRRLVYFSTHNFYDVNEKSSPYCIHKLEMEQLIMRQVAFYNIFRLGHVVGLNSNMNTVVEFFDRKIKNGEKFKLWGNAERSLIGIEDVVKICELIIERNLFTNKVIDVCNPANYSVLEIVKILERINAKKAYYEILDFGQPLALPPWHIEDIVNELGISFNEFYLERLLTKLYKQT